MKQNFDSMMARAMKFFAVLACRVAYALTTLDHGKVITREHRLSNNGTTFELGDVTYFANMNNPAATVNCVSSDSQESMNFLATVISTNSTIIIARTLQETIENYLTKDDVFTRYMLSTVVITSISPNLTIIDESATAYLHSLQVKNIYHNKYATSTVAPGPYLANLANNSLHLFKIYRLYPDCYRDFLYGTYGTDEGNGSLTSLDITNPELGYPLIPVPSRIYSWNDPRPFAGYRVAVKDLFDIKGLKTSGGSHAYHSIVDPANATAAAIQRIVDLGGVIVGKYKLAQFAAGANPWDWQDEHHPFNPRGDGWLTCAGSSSGGGCAIAAYNWLDYAIGTDTGSSIRFPAAVSGTYGQRPSQGMMSLEGVMPGGFATDTAGVFCRDPHDWVRFSKIWYTPSLHQGQSITGLSELEVEDSERFPSTVLYPVDYLPLDNPAAQAILDAFIGNMTSIFNMTIRRFNFSATVQNGANTSVNNLTALVSGPMNIINTRSAWESYARKFVQTWSQLFDGRFPPIDPARRTVWANYNESANTLALYNQAVDKKREAVEWYEANLQYSTPESCSESILVYDIGTGARPFYREKDLNNQPGSYYLRVKPPKAETWGENICPVYGCADFTIPIGQVWYLSKVTFREELLPVTVNLVIKRGCDFVLYNMIEKMADAGILKAVKTGRAAFQ